MPISPPITTENDARADLVTQGVPEAGLLARLYADLDLGANVQRPDGSLDADAIWAIGVALGILENEPILGVDPDPNRGE